MENKDIRKLHLIRAIEQLGGYKAVAEAAETNPKYLSQIRHGRRSMGTSLARRIEKALSLPAGHFDRLPPELDDTESPPEIHEERGIYYQQNIAPVGALEPIPLISYVRAGEWHEAINLYEHDCEMVLATTAPHSCSTFALRVEGPSMTLPLGVEGRSFPHGIIIYVDPEKEALPGDYVVARYNGDSRVTFKRLMIEEGRPVLMPLNPDRKEYPVIRDEFEIIGKVIDATWGGL